MLGHPFLQPLLCQLSSSELGGGGSRAPSLSNSPVGGEGWIPLAAPSSGPPTVTLADGDTEEQAAGGVAEAHRGPVHPSDAFTKRPGQAATVLPRSSRRQISSN